jgi:3-phenylpropionate/trans-cinnamate dioxygenase ferredoxin reductase subunit
MIQRDYLIIGAGIGGASVCETLREYDRKGSVTLVGNESTPPYYRPRLFEAVLAAESPLLEKIAYHPPEWYAENQVELRLGTLITQFNLERRLAVLNTGQVIEFRKACLAMGSRPRRPPVGGANLGNIFYIRNLRDILALREVAALEKNAIIIGGGLVAAEAASTLRGMGLKVQILCRYPSLWQKLIDAETARWFTEFVIAQGVPVLHETLNGFEGKTILRNIQTKSGNRFQAGLVIVAVGTEPNLGLVAKTPLGTPNGVPVNDFMETDEKGIYAVGDIALYPDPVFGGVRRVEHWETTLEQAKIAGGNITGKKRQKFKGIPHHATTVFGMNFEFIGDFRLTPVRFDLEGDRAKGDFVARYFQGPKLMGVLLCNQPKEVSEAATAEILKANGK